MKDVQKVYLKPKGSREIADKKIEQLYVEPRTTKNVDFT